MRCSLLAPGGDTPRTDEALLLMVGCNSGSEMGCAKFGEIDAPLLKQQAPALPTPLLIRAVATVCAVGCANGTVVEVVSRHQSQANLH